MHEIRETRRLGIRREKGAWLCFRTLEKQDDARWNEVVYTQTFSNRFK